MTAYIKTVKNGNSFYKELLSKNDFQAASAIFSYDHGVLVSQEV